MDKEFINQINLILNQKEIDERIKPLIKLYFIGKNKVGEINIEQLNSQINDLCSEIPNVEFVSNEIVSAYSDKSGILTVNKDLFLEEKTDEVILPVFMKFENALNQNNRREYANHIEDFVKAGRISKAASIPVSDRLNKLYEMAEYCYGDIEYKVDELAQEGSWQGMCSKYNKALNNAIITGKEDIEELTNGANLFHYEVFTSESLQDPNFEGPFKNEEYQQKAARILSCIENQNNSIEKDSLVKNIKLFTGCTENMIEDSKEVTYEGNHKISSVLEATMKSNTKEISEEYIISKVQAMLERKPGWDNRIKHLIVPFFIRSQKIYDWDIDAFQERLNELDDKIDKILFEDLGDITTMGDTAMNKIRLNSRVFFDKNRKIYMAYT